MCTRYRSQLGAFWGDVVRPLILFIGMVGTATILGLAVTVAFALHDAEMVTTDALTGIATKHLRTDVSIAGTPISLKSGATQIIGLKVQNPPGFSSSSAINGPEISIEIDVSRSTPNLIYATKINIRRPQVLLEINEGQANLIRLMQALGASDATQSDDQDIRLIVEEIILEEGELSVVIDKFGDSTITVPLPDSRLKDQGLETGIEDRGADPKLVVESLTAFMIKITERATRRIDIAAIASERGVPTSSLDFKTLLAQ